MNASVKPGADETLKTRPSLLSKIRRDDEDGWTRFYDLYEDFIYLAARGARLSHQESQDVVQETIITVRKYIHSFVPDADRGKFRTWLRTLAASRIADHYRERGRNPLEMTNSVDFNSAEDEPATSTTNRIPDLNAEALDRMIDRKLEQAILNKARALAKEIVSVENYQAYDLRVLQEKTAKQVARCLGVNAVTVRVRAFRTKREVNRQVRRIVKELGKAHRGT
ncbi:MAG: RNA polymerase sigma factor [Verrucomicrobia bacterium]|nr:RNA polymerase sigma factor [Verrucomicrobiota bacterium]